MPLLLLRKYKTLLFNSAAIVLLTLGFLFNTFKVINPPQFEYFQKEGEAYVLGRILMAEREGLFFQGGLTGSIFHIPNSISDYYNMYDIYANHKEVNKENFDVYQSMIGGQALTFAIWDAILPFNNHLSMQIFTIFTALFTAIAFTVFLGWVRRNFSLGSAIVVLISLVLSFWITMYGRNLWWVLWAFFLPFLFFLNLLEKQLQHKEQRYLAFKWIMLFSFITMFIKCFYTGYEYITTILIMSGIPFIYYSIEYQWPIKKLTEMLLAYITGALAAILSTFTILAFQISMVAGSLREGFYHIISSYFKRSNGNPEEFDFEYREALSSNVFEVLEKYWNGLAFDFNQYFPHSHWKSLLQIEFGELLLIFVIFTALLFYFGRTKKHKALAITTWISISAPISWHVVFKAHSYVHTHMNFITWYMPFALLGFVIIGIVLVQSLKLLLGVIENLNKWNKHYSKVVYGTALIVCFGIIVINRVGDTMLYEQVTSQENLRTIEGRCSVYEYNKEIWYVIKNPTHLDRLSGFFVHIYPETAQDAHDEINESGFVTEYFWFLGINHVKLFPWNKAIRNIIIKKELPQYSVTHFRTGQHIDYSGIWSSDKFPVQ